MISLFLASMIAIGVYFSRRQTSTDEYFLAGRSIPGWAMGISLFATLVSSVTFVAYPGAGYEGKWWASLVPALSAPLQACVIIGVLIPVYRKVISISVYEYIERRFDRITRIYSTITFFLLSLAKMAFVYYLVALTINVTMGWDVSLVIGGIGLVTLVYTFLGGLEAVIWTDVIQGIILLSGGLIALGAVLAASPLSAGGLSSLAAEHGRFDFGDLSLDLGRPTFLMLLGIGFFEGLQKSLADQAVVQRYLVAPSRREASKGVIVSTVATLAVAGIFTLLGSLLWAFYHSGADRVPAQITRSEEVFSYFLATQMPPLFGAIVLAALLSAAMSTVSSALNSFAAVGVQDYYRLLRPESTDAARLAVGRAFVIVSGLLCIGLALLLVQTRGTAIQLWYMIASVVSAGVVGLFFLGLMSRLASCVGVYAGIVVAVGFTVWATLTTDFDAASATYQTFDLGYLKTPVHSYMVGITSTILFIGVGWGVSWFFPETNLEKQGLTFWGGSR